MTKLWDCFWKGKRLAIVRNVESAALGTHQPDQAAIRDALPRRYQQMSLRTWSCREYIGESVRAHVSVYGKNGHLLGDVNCYAYEFDAATGTRRDL